jgi:hypothetical protein
MSDTVIVALITASGSVLVSMTALLLNYRGFASIDGRFASLERRMDIMQNDLKEFYKVLAEHDKRISKLEDKQQ